jgi:hypothetical protein
MRERPRALATLILIVVVGHGFVGTHLDAQRGQPAPPPVVASQQAPIDLTGTWVSLITEDWRWRMITPAKGEYVSIPITPEAKRVADGWDPQRDQTSGEACRAYGAPGLVRLPGRIRVSWQDDATLKAEFDAGTQTRLLHFGNWQPPAGPPTWQGASVASWEIFPGARGAPPSGDGGGPAPRFGYLKVVTTRLRPGYLRRNGVPYGGNAVFTEHWDVMRRANDTFLVITSIVEDAQYLQIPWVTSLSFKKEADGSKWDPQPCSAAW